MYLIGMDWWVIYFFFKFLMLKGELWVVYLSFEICLIEMYELLDFIIMFFCWYVNWIKFDLILFNVMW